MELDDKFESNDRLLDEEEMVVGVEMINLHMDWIYNFTMKMGKSKRQKKYPGMKGSLNYQSLQTSPSQQWEKRTKGKSMGSCCSSKEMQEELE
jgi:hypothetical protein